jgi:hypothetical protein
VAYQVFWFLGRPVAVRASDAVTHSSARVDDDPTFREARN